VIKKVTLYEDYDCINTHNLEMLANKGPGIWISRWLRSTFHASFFGPSGLRNFVPRMDKIARSHFEQTWESKGEIIAVKVIKQFAFSLVANLFLSVTKGPEFESMAHDVEAFVGGIMKLPIDFPGTAYHKAMLARKSLLRTFDIIIARRQKVQQNPLFFTTILYCCLLVNFQNKFLINSCVFVLEHPHQCLVCM
jgi:cytochrome P450